MGGILPTRSESRPAMAPQLPPLPPQPENSGN